MSEEKEIKKEECDNCLEEAIKDLPQGTMHSFYDNCGEPEHNPQEQYRKVLETIEKIAMINNEDEKDNALLDIYKIAHSYGGNCKNPHSDWKELHDVISKKLKDY